MDQQIAALDSLQAALDASAPPQMKMPCPRIRAAQANMPDVMSYMASSRFGPAFFGALAEQVCCFGVSFTCCALLCLLCRAGRAGVGLPCVQSSFSGCWLSIFCGVNDRRMT